MATMHLFGLCAVNQWFRFYAADGLVWSDDGDSLAISCCGSLFPVPNQTQGTHSGARARALKRAGLAGPMTNDLLGLDQQGP